jgi:hypothetical protein
METNWKSFTAKAQRLRESKLENARKILLPSRFTMAISYSLVEENAYEKVAERMHWFIPTVFKE